MTITLNSEQEMLKFGQDFAKKLKGGEVLALSGDLGAGKTVFTKGLALGLGIKKTITSPTFVLMKIYQGKIGLKKIKLAHLDAYRLTDGSQLADIGINDFLGQPDCITVIEWAERVKEILPSQTCQLNFAYDNKNLNLRKIIWKK